MTLNSELVTGSTADEIKAYFERHEFSYTYDAELRRYKSSILAGNNRRLDIYIYTDREQKLSIAQIIPTEMPRARPVTSLPPGLDTRGRDRP